MRSTISCWWSKDRSRTRRSAATVIGRHTATIRRPAADQYDRMDRPPGAKGAGGGRRRYLRHLRRHSCDAGQSDRVHGSAGLPRARLEIEGRPADRQCSGLPGAARQFHGDLALSAAPARRARADDTGRRARPAAMAVRQERASWAATAPAGTSRPISRGNTGRRNASSRSAAGARRCNAMCRNAAGFPAWAGVPMSAASASAARCRAFPINSCRSWTSRPGGVLSSSLIRPYGELIRRLRRLTNNTLNDEPKWRHNRAELTTGYRPDRPIPRRAQQEHESMATPLDIAERPATGATQPSGNLVEMNWDPITRIVGSLGIYTKIDFENRRVAECHSTSSIFRGYSIFMKGKDPRDSHFITSRICGICGDNHATCSVYAQNMAYGIKCRRNRRVDHQSRRSCRVHVRPQHLPGQSRRRRFLRADGAADESQPVGKGAEHAGAACRRPWLSHDRRHHDGAEPVHRRVLPRDVARQPLHARDVQPDGGPPRPPLDPLSRRGRHGAVGAALHRIHDPAAQICRVHEKGRAVARRFVRFLLRGIARLRGSRQAAHPARLLGRLSGPGCLRLPIPDDDQLGPRHVRDARRRCRRQAGDDGSCRHQSANAHSARPFLLRRLGQPGDLCQKGSARQRRRPEAPVEPDDDPAAAKARF